MLQAYEMFTSFLRKQFDNMLIFSVFLKYHMQHQFFCSLSRYVFANNTDLIYVEFYFYDKNVAKMYTVVIK